MRRGTTRPLVGIDCFGDQDARAACDAFIRVERCSADALADAAIDHAAGVAPNFFQGGGSVRADLIVGGGLDARPDLLRRLGERFRLRGNGPEIADVLADPPRWFDLLDRLGIAYPPVYRGSAGGAKGLAVEARRVLWRTGGDAR